MNEQFLQVDGSKYPRLGFAFLYMVEDFVQEEEVECPSLFRMSLV